MKIKLQYNDGRVEVSEHINALYAEQYVKSQSNVRDYKIVSSEWNGNDYEQQEINTYEYQL